MDTALLLGVSWIADAASAALVLASPLSYFSDENVLGSPNNSANPKGKQRQQRSGLCFYEDPPQREMRNY